MNKQERPAPSIRFGEDAILTTTNRAVSCEGALIRSNRDRHGKMTVLCSLFDGDIHLADIPVNVHTGAGFILSPADARNLAAALLAAATRAESDEADPKP